MAYINEFVPEGEERSFLIPGYSKEHTVSRWTIDKEKDYILFNYHTDRDNPIDEYFAFVYKGRVIDMILNGSEFIDSDIRKWKITRIFIPEDLNREDLLSELRKAVMAYGCFGSPVNILDPGKAVADF
ncbi:MAG: hypothetical protein NC347_11345 [Clostridium sp.]|nr:hypothetical protein [Clostridium sp.]MCM1500089.1 hypothetical protein [Clostridium sp.]